MSDLHDDNAEAEELLFKNRVAEIVDSELKGRLKSVWTVFGAFVAGFALFIGAGLTWKENLLRPIVETVYPTPYISAKVRADLLNDHDFKEELITEEHKQNIAKQIAIGVGDKVDSGYSKTIIFSKDTPEGNNFLIFYARQDQEVEATIIARATAGPEAKLKVKVDNRGWGEPRKFPHSMVQGNITEHLRFDTEPGANLHVLRFTPENLKEHERAVIECVILVKNTSL